MDSERKNLRADPAYGSAATGNTGNGLASRIWKGMIYHEDKSLFPVTGKSFFVYRHSYFFCRK